MRLLHQTGRRRGARAAARSPRRSSASGCATGSFTVLLDVSPQTAWRRIEAEAGDRPLAARGARLRRALRGAAARSTTRRPTRSSTPRRCTATRRCWRRSRRPRALAELPRLVGARRAALVADRSVLRLVGSPFEPFVTVRLPAGEAAKTVAVARQAWTRLAEFGARARRRRRRPGRRRRHRRGGVRGGDLPAGRPLDRRADVARRDGRRRRSAARPASTCPPRRTPSAPSTCPNGSCQTPACSRRCRA